MHVKDPTRCCARALGRCRRRDRLRHRRRGRSGRRRRLSGLRLRRRSGVSRRRGQPPTSSPIGRATWRHRRRRRPRHHRSRSSPPPLWRRHGRTPQWRRRSPPPPWRPRSPQPSPRSTCSLSPRPSSRPRSRRSPSPPLVGARPLFFLPAYVCTHLRMQPCARTRVNGLCLNGATLDAGAWRVPFVRRSVARVCTPWTSCLNPGAR